MLTSIDYSLMSDCDKGLEAAPRKDHDFALSWIQKVGQGRVFYEALGHHESITTTTRTCWRTSWRACSTCSAI